MLTSRMQIVMGTSTLKTIILHSFREKVLHRRSCSPGTGGSFTCTYRSAVSTQCARLLYKYLYVVPGTWIPCRTRWSTYWSTLVRYYS
jgi:hypothetical protein